MYYYKAYTWHKAIQYIGNVLIIIITAEGVKPYTVSFSAANTLQQDFLNNCVFTQTVDVLLQSACCSQELAEHPTVQG